MSTANGGIELRDTDGSARARTERGNIVASFVGPPEGSLETSRGNVHVRLGDDSGALLEAISRDGEVALAGLELDGIEEPARRIGRIGAGGPTLRVYTARGNVRVSGR